MTPLMQRAGRTRLRTRPHDDALPHAADGPERRCVLTGTHGARDCLIRLALGPDGRIAPDVMARAPGRGAWIGVTRDQLDAAYAKGKLAAALARSLKAPVQLPDDLGARIDAAFARALVQRLGMLLGAGALMLGAEKIAIAARSGRITLLLHAADAAADGCAKLDAAWRIGRDMEGSGAAGLKLPLGREALSAALGRENVVHLAIVESAAAAATEKLLERWRNFARWDKEPASSARSGP